MFGWIFGRELKDALAETKKVKVAGVRFTIKKINMLNYLEGTKVLMQTVDTHKNAKVTAPPIPDKKVRDHYKDVLVAGVVKPKLCYNEEDLGIKGEVCVDRLFENLEMANTLYSEIIQYTYGKKKFKQVLLVRKNLSNSI